MTEQDFLLEIGCEELPPLFQHPLVEQMGEQLTALLTENRLAHQQIKTFSTPRRLAIVVAKLAATQTNQTIERLGPSVAHAYDRDGIPTIACMGFANSCGVSADQLTITKSPKGDRVCAVIEQPGQATTEVLPELIQTLMSKLHIPKPMYWGEHDTPFIRPVHWVVMLYGASTIPTTLFDIPTSNTSTGHRFHHPKTIRLHAAKEYSVQLYSQGYVIADFNERKKTIMKQINAITSHSARALIDPRLLEEVTSLVEWPVVLQGCFDSSFLKIPREVLITSMQTHQKCFPVEDAQGQLQPQFILVSNIESSNPNTVIAGNERVIHARLSDAAFFYHNDQQHTLSSRENRLGSVIFQEKLGSLKDKIGRINKLTAFLAKTTDAELNLCKRASQLCKCDLISEMVVEFPSLQGTMGYYYALHDGEDPATATAIKEHYLPRFAKDTLPASSIGATLAIADRIDTLVGIFGINQIPTGDKDPFALRRAALGILRIIIEKKYAIDLVPLIKRAQKGYGDCLTNEEVVTQTFDFIMTRLKAWYTEQDVSPSVFAAVSACNISQPYDFHQRVQAVKHFQTLPEAQSLAQANKRVRNLLKKQTKSGGRGKIKPELFDSDSEHALASALNTQHKTVQGLFEQADYIGALTQLASLQGPVDQFFEDVMVMDENSAKRDNRLNLLAELQALFLQVADISLLQ